MEMLEWFLSNTSTAAFVASKGNNFRSVCTVAVGVWSTLLLGQLSHGNKKIHWEKNILYLWCRRRVGLGSKILASGHHDTSCPEFTLWFLIAIWGAVFFLSIVLTLNPLGLMLHELISRWPYPACHEFAEGSWCVGKFCWWPGNLLKLQK